MHHDQMEFIKGMQDRCNFRKLIHVIQNFNILKSNKNKNN